MKKWWWFWVEVLKLRGIWNLPTARPAIESLFPFLSSISRLSSRSIPRKMNFTVLPRADRICNRSTEASRCSSKSRQKKTLLREQLVAFDEAEDWYNMQNAITKWTYWMGFAADVVYVSISILLSLNSLRRSFVSRFLPHHFIHVLHSSTTSTWDSYEFWQMSNVGPSLANRNARSKSDVIQIRPFRIISVIFRFLGIGSRVEMRRSDCPFVPSRNMSSRKRRLGRRDWSRDCRTEDFSDWTVPESRWRGTICED